MKRLLRMLRVLIVLCVLAPMLTANAQETAYDSVGDSYPKNENIDILNYSFEIQITDNSELIQVTSTVEALYKQAGQQSLRLDLVKKSDALDGKGMVIDEIRLDNQPLAFVHDGDELLIDLGRETRAHERIKVSVQYHGIPATGPVIGPNKYGDFTFFSENWSSKARNWLASVDHPHDKATSEFIVTAPARLQVVSNGLLVEETDLGDGLRKTHWKNSVPISTWLLALAAAEFAVQYVDTFEGKSIQTWVYRQDRDAGFYDFAVPTKQALAYYSDLVGPFVYEKLANIQSNSVGGGMEAASSIFYGDNSVTGNRDRRWQHVIVHEVAHQWFGNSVTEYDWNHIWLSEGFATYYTLLFREHAYGKDDFIAGLKDSRNRVINFYKKDYDFQLIRDDLPDLDNISGAMMYQKGAWTLHMLREIIGVEQYHKGVRAYYAAHINGTADTGDFRRHMEAASGVDLRAFFKQWLYQGGIPQLEGTWDYRKGALSIHLSQKQEKYGFDVSVDFDVHFADGSVERITLESAYGQEQTISKNFTEEVVDVIIDPDTRILAQLNFVQK